MSTVIDRSVPFIPPEWQLKDEVICCTELPGDIRVVTVFNGMDPEGTMLFDTLVYVEDVCDIIHTSFSYIEAWTNHADTVSLTGARIYVA